MGMGRTTRGRRHLAATALACALVPGSQAAAASTPAGQVIRNVATLTLGTQQQQVASNEVTLTVAHVVDVAVAAVVASRPQADVAREEVAFVVRNTGNAAERYRLSAAATPAGVSVIELVAEGLANGEIVLAAGEERRVVVALAGVRDAAGDATVTLTATAATGHGAPGTPVGEAVIGAGGASASARAVLTRGTGALSPGAAPTLAKSQTVTAPDGSARPVSGAIVTYRLEAAFPVAAPAVVIDDAIPAGTVFVPGSVTLDGAAQSDAADVDAARFDGTAVRVALGDQPGGATRIVRFQVRIK